MGFIISINGANFVPYSSVHTPSPLVRKIRPSNEAEKVEKESDHPDSFADTLGALPQRQINTYKEVQETNEHASKQIVHAKELMSTPVITLSKDATVAQGLRLLEERHIHHIPIVDSDDKLIGIVSDRSLLLADKSIVIMEIMNKRIIAAESNVRLQEIARVMIENNVRSIPIVDTSERLVGIITSTDIIRSVFKNPNVDLWV